MSNKRLLKDLQSKASNCRHGVFYTVDSDWELMTVNPVVIHNGIDS